MKNFLYWQGFLLADATITTGSHGRPKFCLELAHYDIDHLDKMRSDLGLSNKIQVYSRKNKGVGFKNQTSTSAKISTQIPEFLDKLKEVIIWENKTFTARANKQQYSSKSFWRGIIDGDGCLSYNLEPSKGSVVPKITLTTGSKELIKQWQSYMLEKCGVTANYQERKRGGTYDLKVTHMKAYRVVKFLYDDAKISLDRKQKIAKEIVSWGEQKLKEYSERGELIKRLVALRESGLTFKEIGVILDKSDRTVQKIYSKWKKKQSY